MAGRKVNLIGKAGRPKKENPVELEEVNSIIEEIIKSGGDKFKKELMGLNGKEFVDRFAQLLEYVKPKLARTEHINEHDSSLTLNLISSDNPNIQLTKGIDEEDSIIEIGDSDGD